MLNREEYIQQKQQIEILKNLRAILPSSIYHNHLHPEGSLRFAENLILFELWSNGQTRQNQLPKYQIHMKHATDSGESVREAASRLTQTWRHSNVRLAKNKILMLHMGVELYSPIQVGNAFKIIKETMSEVNILLEQAVDISELFKTYLSKQEFMKNLVNTAQHPNYPFKANFEDMIQTNKILFLKDSQTIFVLSYGPSVQPYAYLATLGVPLFLVASQFFKEELQNIKCFQPTFLNAVTNLVNMTLGEAKQEALTEAYITIQNFFKEKISLSDHKKELIKSLKENVEKNANAKRNTLEELQRRIDQYFTDYETHRTALIRLLTMNTDDHFLVKMVDSIDRFPQLLNISTIAHNSGRDLSVIIIASGPMLIDEELVHRNYLTVQEERTFYERIRDGKIMVNFVGGIRLRFSNGTLQDISAIRDYDELDLGVDKQTLKNKGYYMNPHHEIYSCLGSSRIEIQRAVGAENAFGVILNSIKSILSLNLSDSAARGSLGYRNINITVPESNEIMPYAEYERKHQV